jgi:hypothetical protein
MYPNVSIWSGVAPLSDSRLKSPASGGAGWGDPSAEAAGNSSIALAIQRVEEDVTRSCSECLTRIRPVWILTEQIGVN